MKKTFVLSLLALLAAVTVNAQQKIGYTNIDYILLELPDAKQIQTELENTSKQYENALQTKMKDYEALVKEYQANEKAWSDVIKADKAKTIQNMEGQIQEFRQNSQTSLSKKQEQLLQPVLEKIQRAINEVAKENGYAYVFNSDAGRGTSPILLVAPENENISDLVLKKLGVTPKPAGAAPAAPKK
jgi:outer membrane protein